LSPEYIFGHLDLLSQTDYPLEGYDALASSIFVASFKGKVAKVKGFVVYRPATKQLVVSITGTQTILQAIYDLRTIKHRRRDGGRVKYRVHTGFWKLYKGMRSLAIDGLKRGMQDYDVEEVVITGHSMGGAMAYLLANDLLQSDDIISPSVPFKLVAFGAPRVGDQDFVNSWNTLLDDYRSEHGSDSIHEYCIKAYNDGVTLLPPFELDFRHCTKHPLYFVDGRLFHVPESEREFALFDVTLTAEEKAIPPMHPKGGHNYYNGRDMEKLVRRMEWLEKVMSKSDESRRMELYQAQVLRSERST